MAKVIFGNHSAVRVLRTERVMIIGGGSDDFHMAPIVATNSVNIVNLAARQPRIYGGCLAEICTHAPQCYTAARPYCPG